MPTFETTLRLERKTATGIEVPPHIVAELGTGKKPAVTVTLNGYTYRSTVAVMGGRYMLPVSAEHRQGAGVQAGDHVSVTLHLDTEPRQVTVPDDLQAALDGTPGASERFRRLSYSQQRQHVLAVEGTKNPETRARRVAKTIQMLTEGA
ncbi:YdeI/OmpD-associated family protein [Deinococcus sp. HMF7604]|uniref:YdeI/OmpD-associated family protein n=1 Tax=Deinococcus betulae TaxID=2873312 RepID=UPI001CCC3F8A|nr:YdeI/OmpD-associated family protein [Deinococcus betulae]MBZ9751084.1 YdeI/OmpD-associated family protein [Deinococcus betulae]